MTAKKLRVISLAEDKDGNIWLGTWAGGVFVLDPHREVLLGHYELRAPVYEMIRDRFHSIWFISGWTLFKAEAPGSVLVRTPTKFQMFNIVEDSSRNCLWLVGNHGNEVKLYRFDYQTQAVKLLNVNLKAHFIKSAALDSKNRLWLGSWGRWTLHQRSRCGPVRKD